MATDMMSSLVSNNGTSFGNMDVNSTDDNSVTLNTTAVVETTTQGDWRTFRFEDYTQRAVMASIICLVSVVGFVGNVMVLVAAVLSRKLQTRTNVFVVNLAVADLVASFLSPFMAVALLSKAGWPWPEIVCSTMAAIGFTCLICSIVNLAVIAINRYVLITKASGTYRSIYTPKKIAGMVVFTWVYPALVCSLPFLGVGKWGYSDKYKTCTQDTSHKNSGLFSFLASALVFPVPLIILFVCYFKIYRHVTGHMKKMMGKGKEVEMTGSSNSSSAASTRRLHKNPPASFSKRQVEITKNLFYVVCGFVACLAPFCIAVLTAGHADPAIPWTGTLLIFNSCINPIIYGAKHPHFREVFRHMLRCRYHTIPEPSGCLRKIRSR